MSGPYGSAAVAYWEAGWPSPLPVPFRKKGPPPEGYTGHNGADPSYADVYDMANNGHAGDNIVLRLPDDVIGIDVDMYDGKRGRETLAQLEAKWGPLPDTWMSSSREDGSGIRFYRVPAGMTFHDPGDGIEIIRYGYRYAMVWPSIHPEGRLYRWMTLDGLAHDGKVPQPDAITELPASWVDGLSTPLAGNGHKRAEDDGERAREWMSAERIPFHHRRAWLLSYAGWLRGKNVRPADAQPMFRKRWQDCDQPPNAGHEMPWTEAKKILDDIYSRYEPGQEIPEPTVLNEEPPRRRTLADRTFTRERLADLPKPEPLIENTLDRRTVAAVIGPQGTLKSFLLISWLCSVATGTPWLGRPVKQGPVKLIAAEGAYGIHGRISAWEQQHGIDVPADVLSVVAGPVNLTSSREVAELRAAVDGHALVAADTLARCMVGADENSAKDMGVAVDSLYRLRDATGDGAVVVAHHTPKSNGNTGRGSSAFEFGIDTIYVADGDAQGVTLTRAKRKDGPLEDVLNGYLHVLGMSGLFADRFAALTNAADKLLSAFMSAFAQTGCTKAELRNVADMVPATFHRSLNSLLTLGILRNTGTEKRPFYIRVQAGQA